MKFDDKVTMSIRWSLETRKCRVYATGYSRSKMQHLTVDDEQTLCGREIWILYMGPADLEDGQYCEQCLQIKARRDSRVRGVNLCALRFKKRRTSWSYSRRIR